MTDNCALIFDEIILKQLKRAAKNQGVKRILAKMLDKLELVGSSAGKLLDSQLSIYEIKNKHPQLDCISSQLKIRMRYMFLNLK